MAEGGNHVVPAAVVAQPEHQPLNFIPQQNQLVSLLHTVRAMRIFGVTENELRTLTIVNAAIAALFSLGTGCFAYLLNLSTDASFAGTLPPSTENLLGIMRGGLIAFGLGFYLIGIYIWFQRRSFIETIKTESDPAARKRKAEVQKGRLRRAWKELWS